MNMPGTDTPVIVQRVLPVTPDQAFDAWLEPAQLRDWMGPLTDVQVDPKVGGRFRIVMSHDHGDYEHSGEYLTIDPPSLLSFTWMSSATDNRPTVVTVELREHDGGTELILTHRQLPPSRIEAHRKGWTDIVRKLDEAISQPLR